MSKLSRRLLFITLIFEFCHLQEDATVLFKDNQGALLLMVNAQRPTKCTYHMDIKSFGLQDLVHRDLLCLQQIVTADNYADAMSHTFLRHTNFIMGGRVVPAAEI